MAPKSKKKSPPPDFLTQPVEISPDGRTSDADSGTGTATASKGRGKYKRRKTFIRELDQFSPNSDVKLKKKEGIFPPNSSPQALIRQVRRTGKPTCIIFGQIREFLYPDYFFCSPCKLYENELSVAGNNSSRIKRNSKVFRCQAKHTEFSFPTKRKFSGCCTETTTSLITNTNKKKQNDVLEMNDEAIFFRERERNAEEE